ncbi:MAG: type II toxin-antitoxin system death-on-curing family toxin [Planctomycetes bacterium]|nr:type II toxin-antitoxin system death-on-curing family toxin [Planctomycetota bacterium]
MTDIRYLTLNNVLQLHELFIENFGGSAGLRDAGLLDSALAMPQAAFGGKDLHPDVPSKAGAYMFHISQAHAFIDGNKRVALATALAFIRLNGMDVNTNDDELIPVGMGVAAGEVSKDELIDFFRRIIIQSDG